MNKGSLEWYKMMNEKLKYHISSISIINKESILNELYLNRMFIYKRDIESPPSADLIGQKMTNELNLDFLNHSIKRIGILKSIKRIYLL